MADHPDCIVVGAGIVGLLTARELHKAGMQVTVIDRSRVGGESSWAGGGLLSPLYPWRYSPVITRLARIGQAFYPELVQQLTAETGIDAQWHRSGLLVAETNEITAAIAWGAEYGNRVESLDRQALDKLQPGLDARLEGAIWLPDVAQVRNPRLLKALHQSLRHSGVRILEQTRVTGLEVSHGRITGVRTAAGLLSSDSVVVASGAWTTAILGELALTLEVHPVKGQMIMLQTEPQQLERVVLYKGHYLIPRVDGLVLVGSTLEEAGFNKDISDVARSELIQAASRMMPQLAGAKIQRQWAGLRPGSDRELPFVGPHPEIKGLYVSSGHYRNGFSLAPGSARLLVKFILSPDSVYDYQELLLPESSTQSSVLVQ